MRTFAIVVTLAAAGPALADVTNTQAIALCERAILERVQSTTARFRKGAFEGRVMELKFGLTDANGKRSRAECRISKRDGGVIELELADS